MHERFGKDQYHLLLCQLFCIRQLASVLEYIEHFSSLVDQLSVYDSVIDPLYYATHFVDGLCDDIRVVVLMQRPMDMDTAGSLALLQEKVIAPGMRDEFHKGDRGSWGKPMSKMTMPLPPPNKMESHVHVLAQADRRPLVQGQNAEETLASLRAFRRAKGLCECCTKNWQQGHTCITTIQLHIL